MGCSYTIVFYKQISLGLTILMDDTFMNFFDKNIVLMCLSFCGDIRTIIPNEVAGWQSASLGSVQSSH